MERAQFWSRGPEDKDVWSAEEYRETVYPFPEFWLEDARGRMPNGRYWRSVHIFQGVHEEASYHDVDQATAAVLDLSSMVCVCDFKGRAKDRESV